MSYIQKNNMNQYTFKIYWNTHVSLQLSFVTYLDDLKVK